MLAKVAGANAGNLQQRAVRWLQTQTLLLFLLDTLKGDQAAHAALRPDAAMFPGIEYSSTLQ